MRKPTNSGGASGKGKPYRGKDSERSERKSPSTRSFGNRPSPAGKSFSGRNSSSEGVEERTRGNADRAERSSARGKSKPFSLDDKPARNFDRADSKPAYKKRTPEERPASGRKPKPRNFDDKPRRSFENTDQKPVFKKNSREENTYGTDKFAGRTSKPRSFEEKPRRKFESSEDRIAFNKEAQENRPSDGERKPRKEFGNADNKREKPAGAKFDSNARKYGAPKYSDNSVPERKTRLRERDDEAIKRVKFDDFEEGKVFSNSEKNKTATKNKPSKNKTKYKKPTSKSNPQTGDGLTRLNKYLSNAGVASRRDADTLIQSGVVKVNGVVIDQLGYKISEGDKVTYGDAAVKGERKVYLLLNKPKDYITTVDDPQERKTVMELVSKACKERIYPVGRLDRNTTGLLLFTNDGEMTTKLTHPKFGVKKVYHVSLNKGLKPEDFKAISEGLELEDGTVKADDLAFVGEGKKEIGIEIHSGRNRIVRRIFEQLGYDVLKLDRVVFAGLTKKDLPRGKHRFLTGKEISFLQMIG